MTGNPNMLRAMEKTISLTELERNAERIAKDIEVANTVYRIKRPGHRSMMLIDHQYFESWVATIDFVQRHPNWEAEMEEGQRDILEGRGIPLEVAIKELGLEGRYPKPTRSKPSRSARGTKRARPARRRRRVRRRAQ